MSILRSSEIKWFAQSHSVLMADAGQTQTTAECFKHAPLRSESSSHHPQTPHKKVETELVEFKAPILLQSNQFSDYLDHILNLEEKYAWIIWPVYFIWEKHHPVIENISWDIPQSEEHPGFRVADSGILCPFIRELWKNTSDVDHKPIF